MFQKSLKKKPSKSSRTGLGCINSTISRQGSAHSNHTKDMTWVGFKWAFKKEFPLADIMYVKSLSI